MPLIFDGHTKTSKDDTAGNSRTTNSAQQQQQQQDEEIVVANDEDILFVRGNGKRTTGRRYYERLIDRNKDVFCDTNSNPAQRSDILRSIADAVHYGCDDNHKNHNLLHAVVRKRRFLKSVPNPTVTRMMGSRRYVELSDDEIAVRIKKSFLAHRIKMRQLHSETAHKSKQNQQMFDSSLSPQRYPQHHPHLTGTFVPRLKCSNPKKKPRDGTSSKLLSNNNTNTNTSTTSTTNTNNKNQTIVQQHPHGQSHQQKHPRSVQQRLMASQQDQQRESEVIEAEMRKLWVQQQQQQQQQPQQPHQQQPQQQQLLPQQQHRAQPQPLPTHTQLFDALFKSMESGQQHETKDNNTNYYPQQQQQQMNGNPSEKTTKKANSKPPKKVPARKKKPAAKKRPPQHRKPKIPTTASTSTPAVAKKSPLSSSSPLVAETAPKDTTLATDRRNAAATAAAIANRERDIAAGVLMGLSRATTFTKVYCIGTRTKKYFKEHEGWYRGTIKSYNTVTKFYSIEYEDNDNEELEYHEINTGSLPPHRYDIGTQYEVFFVSKQSGSKLGWFVGTIQSKYYHVPKFLRGHWRYSVVYSDGDSEDADEAYITESINTAKHKRGRRKAVGTPAIAKEHEREHEHERDAQQSPESSHEESSNKYEDIKSIAGVDESSSSSEDDDDDDDELSSEDERDPNPKKIPHWTGKQHQQFTGGLRKYGLGNLEDIHEADCIPGRSFQELIRYWQWYAKDLEQKGLILNYETKGTVNGKKATRYTFDNDDDDEEKNDDDDDSCCEEGLRTGTWSVREQEMVAKAYVFHGSSYKAMSDFMKTRNPSQIRSYFNAHKRKILNDSQKYLEEEESKAGDGGEDADRDRDADDDDDDDAMSDTPKADTAAEPTTLIHKKWTPGEHALLVEAIAIYGRKITKELAAYMKFRSAQQIAGYIHRNATSLDKDAEAKQRHYKTIAKRTGAWSGVELSRLVEGHAIFGMDSEKIDVYVKTRDADQVKSLLEANPSQYKDESAFDLGDHFAFPIELFHVLNVAPFEGFDHIVSWNGDGGLVLIHDNDQFAKTVFPRYSHKGTSIQKFYDNLKLFGFQELNKNYNDEKKKRTFHHTAFRKGNYKKVEHHCRKFFE